jgi:hypothetical protein
MMNDKDSRAARDYERFAAVCAVLSAAAGLLYAVAFIVLGNLQLSAVLLLLGGVLTTAALVGVYARLRAVDAAASRLGLTLGVVGAVGSAIHGGYDLAVGLHPVAAGPLDAPNAVDPRGLLTFGAAGLGLLVMSWLIRRGGQFPRPLGYLAALTGVLLVVLYLARLIVLDPANPLVLGPALLTGFVLSPLLSGWLGYCLSRFTAEPGAHRGRSVRTPAG